MVAATRCCNKPSDRRSHVRNAPLIWVDLRREFDNFGSAARTACSRWSRGVYRQSKRPSEPCVADSRGQAVRSLEMAQTFLTDSEVDELVAAFEAGATLRGLAKQFHIHRLTAAAHLARRGVPVRQRGLDSAQTKEAAQLYQAGWMNHPGFGGGSIYWIPTPAVGSVCCAA